MQIYFATIGDRIKVGISRNAKTRLQQLGREAASPVTLIGMIKGDLSREHEIHNALKGQRIKGEWYRDNAETRAVIQNCFNNFDLASPPVREETNFSRVCRALWPRKTAAELAARVGCTTRCAEHYLYGDREPSAGALLAVISELMTKPRAP